MEEINQMPIPEFNFGDKKFAEREGGSTYVHSYANVVGGDFDSYVSALDSEGFSLRESHCFGDNRFLTFEHDNDALFLSYYPDIGEARIVHEPNSTYLTYSDCPGKDVCSPLLTHIDITDYGLCYVIRLSDSRFIIFDGGFAYAPDAERLMECLSSQCRDEKPRIAAWILTHPHHDHYPGFTEFCAGFSDRVVIEKLIFNFPDLDEETILKMPALVKSDELEPLKLFYETVDNLGATVYRAHTGQIYKAGEATMEILSSPDDVFFTPVNDINPHSLVIKMDICSQTIMWCADTYFDEARLADRYGTYLKCDMVQLTHHGYCGGAKREYRLMNPSVCLAPVCEEQCLSTIDFYYDFNKYLFCDLNLEDIVCGGDGNKVLDLPYKPHPNSRMILNERIKERQKDVGANVWFFADVSPDDLNFTFVNMTYSKAQVFADLIYANSVDNVYSIEIMVSPRSSVKKNITDPGEVNGDARPFNPYPLSQKGVKKGELISVRFTSKIPVVISGNKPYAYCH